LDEQLMAFNAKIMQFTDFMNDMIVDEDSAESLQKIMIGIEKILKTRQSLLDAIERRGERQKIAGDKNLSFLERRKEIKEL
jgi:regulator of sigma D